MPSPRAFRILLALACLLFVASSTQLYDEEHYQKHFVTFIRVYEKKYEASELFRRLSVFKANFDFIEKHNMEASRGKHSFFLGLNQFADMTNTEYKASHRGLKNRMYIASPAVTPLVHEFVPSAPLPPSVDWRQKGAVTPVKDQGQCGSCWSFSATAAMESAHFLATKQLLSLSEQMCVDCVNGGKDDCNTGGQMSECFMQVIRQGGDELESDYPYEATSGHPCRFDKKKAVAPISSYVNVSSGDENALQSAVASHVVSVAIDASSIWFQLYSSGVFDYAQCGNTENALDHGVTVVGYGHDATSNKDYWIVKNSWGTSWGQAGYILMARNKKNQCGISLDASYPIV